MNLNPMNISVFVFPAESVSAIFMHVTVSLGCAPITEVNHILMASFVVMRNEIPKVVSTF